MSVFDAQYIINAFIAGEINGSSRFKRINTPEKILQFIRDKDLIENFKQQQFTVDYRILLHSKLYKFIQLMYNQDKIDNDIITCIKRYPSDYYFDLIGERTHNEILSRIPLDKLLDWYRKNLITTTNIRSFLMSKNMTYLLQN